MPRRDHYVVTPPTSRFGAVSQLECFSDEIWHRRRLPLVIDLGALEFIKPVAVVGLVMFMREMISRGRRLHVTFPGRARVLNYLLGIGLPAIMDELGQWEWPNDFPRKATKGLRPMIKLTRFSTTNEVDQIAELMADVFLSEGLASLLKPCHVVFSELAENVTTHAEASGYVLAQRYEYAEGPVIDIAVGDCGIGVRKALWKNLSLRTGLVDDRNALMMAMTDGVTGISTDRYRGYGLGHVSAELSAPGRWLVIRSGNATAYWREGQRTRVKMCGGSVGTLVHAMIPC